MADVPADTPPQEKTEKKKKDKSGNEEKKPKKSSVKKEKTQEPPKTENVSHDSLDIKKAEVVEPKYVETAVGPDHEPEVQPEPEAQSEPETQPDPETQPQPETTQPEPELEPKTEPEAQVEPPEARPELVAEQNEVPEEARPQPRRKPSRRNYELEIDEEKLTQLKEAFQIFDFNRDGVIDKDDLRKIQIAMGQDVKEINEEELDRMMSEACEPLDFDAFVMLLGYKTIELDPEEVLRSALARWDSDGTGLISEDKLKYDLMHLGDKFTEHEVNMALEDAPLRCGFGFYKDIRMIDYVKFCHVLCGLRKKTKEPSLEEYGLDV